MRPPTGRRRGPPRDRCTRRRLARSPARRAARPAGGRSAGGRSAGGRSAGDRPRRARPRARGATGRRRWPSVSDEGRRPSALHRAGRLWARQSGGVEVDVAVVGAGGAGLSLLVQLAVIDRAVDRLRAPPSHVGEPPSVVLIDPVHHRDDDRTWCFWDRGLSGRAGRAPGLVPGRWSTPGDDRGSRRAPLRYVMVRSSDFYALADDAAARRCSPDPGGRRRGGRRCGPGRRSGRAGPLGLRLPPGAPVRPARPRCCSTSAAGRCASLTRLRPRHAGADGLLGAAARPRHRLRVRAAQRTHGAARRVHPVLRDRLPSRAYDQALSAYLYRRYGAAPTDSVVETRGRRHPDDRRRARPPGRAAGCRIGTAGGATRASTGYTFATMQRQSEVIAAALVAGVVPGCRPPPTGPATAGWTPSCCAPSTRVTPTAPTCSCGCSTAMRPNACCASSTVDLARRGPRADAHRAGARDRPGDRGEPAGPGPTAVVRPVDGGRRRRQPGVQEAAGSSGRR